MEVHKSVSSAFQDMERSEAASQAGVTFEEALKVYRVSSFPIHLV